VFSVGVDKAARAFDLATGQSVQVGSHGAPVKCCRWVDAPSGGYLVTGSWDKTVKVCLPVTRCTIVSILMISA
jgi:mRNA export factor